MGKNQWVTKHQGEWTIKGEGNSKATKVVSTQKEAIKVAREIAKHQGSELIIQGRDNKIVEKRRNLY